VRNAVAVVWSYPRRRQLRRLRLAASHSALAAAAFVGALLIARDVRLSLALLLLSGAFALASRHALRLAARSRVGAQSETKVRRALERLRPEGWRVRHAANWPGGGDLDHVARAPSGVGFVIEEDAALDSRPRAADKRGGRLAGASTAAVPMRRRAGAVRDSCAARSALRGRAADRFA
jgi:hypothetical protein